MNETSKANLRRYQNPAFSSRYFVGNGIDIGGGLDCLAAHIPQFPQIISVRNWDLEDGDAQYLHGLSDDSFDFVYSSHCLEHMQNPVVALENWLRVLKPGGYLIVSIPDEDMYEHGVWPSQFNSDHKWTFTLYKAYQQTPRSINLIELVKEFSIGIECEQIIRITEGYIKDLPGVDQTLGAAECAIEFIWQKQKPKAAQAMLIADQLERQGQTQRALDTYEDIIKIAPLEFNAYNRLAALLVSEGYAAKAEKVWNACLHNMPELYIARIFHALFLISIGRYDEGFRLRDALVPDGRRTPTPPPTTYPKWRGEELRHKTIVIWTEFGFGDEIMFARFASVFKNYYGAAKVSIVCQAPLLALFKTLLDIDLVLSEEMIDQLPEHDYWVFPHSIPVHYSLEENPIPAPIPYFQVPKIALDNIEGWLPPKNAARIRVGLVSKGSPTHENDELRSVASLDQFQELFQIPGIDWVDLQKDSHSGFSQINLPKNISVVHLGGRLTDFMQTGAICSQLDLVICVDTSIAHLAGALNVPVWLMLPTFADWRWGVCTSSSPWYPSVQIFRQKQIGDWTNVIWDIRLGLCEKLREIAYQ